MSHINKPVVVINYDNVLKNTWLALCLFHNAHHGTNYTPETMTNFDLSVSWGCSKEEVCQRLDIFFRSEHDTEATPVDGAFEALKQLSWHYELHIVTARPIETRGGIAAWIGRHYPRLFQQTHFTNSRAFIKMRPYR